MEKTKLTVPYIIRNWSSLKMKQKRAILSVVIVGVAAVLFLVALIVGIVSCAGKTPEAEPTAEAVLPIPALLRAPGAAVNPTAESDRTESVDANAALPAIENGEDASIDNVTTDGEPIDGDATDPNSADATADEPESTYQSLKKHDKGEAVTVLQSRLMELGYLEIEETTDYFGSSTEYALVLFQRQHDLKQDGVAGAETLALLYGNDAQPYVLKEGAEGRDVKMLQEQLVELGYLSSDEVDRIYGSVTINAVQEFQKRNGLSADGKAGEKTLEKLYSDEAKISKSLEAKIRAEEKAAKEKEKGKSSSNATAAPKKETRIEKFIKAAKSKIGCEYILGDSGPNTFDCSGFVTYCLRQAGVSTLRLNAAGFSRKSSWKTVSSIGDLEKGDILFFRSDSSDRVSHCGIYIGSGTMIDASSSNGKVVKRSVSQYWKRNFVNAKRPW